MSRNGARGANTRNRVYGATGNPLRSRAKLCRLRPAGRPPPPPPPPPPPGPGHRHGPAGDGVRPRRKPAQPGAFCAVHRLPPLAGSRSEPDRRNGTGLPMSTAGPMARNVEGYRAAAFGHVAPRPARSLDPDQRRAHRMDRRRVRWLRRGPISQLSASRQPRTSGSLPPKAASATTLRDRVGRLSSVLNIEEATPDCSGADRIFAVFRAVGFLGAHRQRLERFPEKVGPNVRANIEEGLGYSASDVAEALAAQAVYYRAWQDFFDTTDFLISPAVTISPRPWRELYPTEIDGTPTQSYYHWLALAYATTIAGHPSITIPCGTDTKRPALRAADRRAALRRRKTPWRRRGTRGALRRRRGHSPASAGPLAAGAGATLETGRRLLRPVIRLSGPTPRGLSSGQPIFARRRPDMAIKSIIAAYSGDAEGSSGLHLAAQMARKYGAHLTGVVWHGPTFIETRYRGFLSQEVVGMLRTRDAEMLDEIRSDFEKRVAVEGLEGQSSFLDLDGRSDFNLGRTCPGLRHRRHGQPRRRNGTRAVRGAPRLPVVALRSGRPLILVAVRTTARRRSMNMPSSPGMASARPPRGRARPMAEPRNEGPGDRPDGGREAREAGRGRERYRGGAPGSEAEARGSARSRGGGRGRGGSGGQEGGAGAARRGADEHSKGAEDSRGGGNARQRTRKARAPGRRAHGGAGQPGATSQRGCGQASGGRRGARSHGRETRAGAGREAGDEPRRAPRAPGGQRAAGRGARSGAAHRGRQRRGRRAGGGGARRPGAPRERRGHAEDGQQPARREGPTRAAGSGHEGGRVPRR